MLLTLHPRIGLWVQLGGHIEPEDGSLLAAALSGMVASIFVMFSDTITAPAPGGRGRGGGWSGGGYSGGSWSSGSSSSSSSDSGGGGGSFGGGGASGSW